MSWRDQPSAEQRAAADRMRGILSVDFYTV
jgi:hypothetical protein